MAQQDFESLAPKRTNSLAPKNCGFASEDQYFAFCASKDWIQDTCEALSCHRERDFSRNPYQAYIEFWGVLQAVYVLQDAIAEMKYSLTGRRSSNPTDLLGKAGKEIRNHRNLLAGHPTRKTKGSSQVLRSVSGRENKSYSEILFTKYSGANWKTDSFALGDLLDNYDDEASHVMEDIYRKLKLQLGVEETLAG